MLTAGAKNIKLPLTAGVGNDYAVAWGVSHAIVGYATSCIGAAGSVTCRATHVAVFFRGRL